MPRPSNLHCFFRQGRHICVCSITTFLVLFMGPVELCAKDIDDAQARLYRKANTLVEEDPFEAHELAKSLKPIPHADDMRLQLLSRSALNSAHAAEAVTYLLEHAKTTDLFSKAFAARLDAVEMYILLGHATEANALLTVLEKTRTKLKARFNTKRHLNARTLRIRHDLALGSDPHSKHAKRIARELLLFYPDEVPTRRQGLVRTSKKLSSRDRYIRAKNLYASWSYHDARKEFKKLKNHKTYGTKATWYLAQIALNKLRDDFPQAEKLFRTFSTSSKVSRTKRAQALYQLARAQMRQNRYDDCLKTLHAYIKTYPNGANIERAYYYLGWLPYDARQNKKAIRGFERYIKRYGRKQARLTTYVHGFRAWAYMRDHRWKKAIVAWKSLLGFGNPIVAGKAYYWMAFAHHKLKNNNSAIKQLNTLRKRYPITYYSMLGEQLRAKINGQDERASKVWWPKQSGTYKDTPHFNIHTFDETKIPQSARSSWRRTKVLVKLGEGRAARKTLAHVESRVLHAVPKKEQRRWLHTLGFAVDNYNTMWRKATGGTISWVPPAPDPDTLRSVMAYPRAYSDVVYKVAKEFDLPPYLFWSIMRQESRYKPNAISYTDAVGALQMIPKTARKVARDLGTVYNPRTFHHPEVGFRFSAFYMKKLLDTFDGLLVPMASAYNSGPKVIKRWFDRNPKASFPWLIEEFEYNEGRSYGRKVAEHLLHYIYLYEKDASQRHMLLDKLFPTSRDITIPDHVGY